MSKIFIPEGYKSPLSPADTQKAIEQIKSSFQKNLKAALNLRRVSAPLFVESSSGLNDDLNGVERPVAFTVTDGQREAQVIHSLAKWKRLALKRYGFTPGEGLFTDMNAIRRDEELDNIHSVYVDQWDWEKVILPEQRSLAFLQETAQGVMDAVERTAWELEKAFPALKNNIHRRLFPITTQQLEDKYPSLTPAEREDEITKEHPAVLLMQIGGKLASGIPHGGRAPDYDDWALNGDILLRHPLLPGAFELSSMGVRVNEESLKRQLKEAHCQSRAALPFHKMLLNGELPLTVGGGIGQSRLCMLLLGVCHIGEIQSSLWDPETVRLCEEKGILLL